MRDASDTRTSDMLVTPSTPGARRQAAYAERQRAVGRRQHAFWLTEHEAAEIATFLEQLRQAKETT